MNGPAPNTPRPYIDAWAVLQADDRPMDDREWQEWWGDAELAVRRLVDALQFSLQHDDPPTMVPIEALGILATVVRQPRRVDNHHYDEMVELLCRLGDMAGEARDEERAAAAQAAEAARRQAAE